MDSGNYACSYSGPRMWSVFDHSAVDIAANPTLDAGTFLLQVPPFSGLYDEWTSPRTPDSPSDSFRSEFNAEASYFSGLHPSIQYTFIRSIDGEAATPPPENLITGIHDEGFPLDNLSNSIESIPQGTPYTPTVVKYREESVSRDKPQQFQKTGIESENASSQSSRRPPGMGGTPHGPYVCDICGKGYAQLQGLRRHYRAKHNPSSCSFCDFKWSRPYQYRAHIRTKHRGVLSDVSLDERNCHRDANTAARTQPKSVSTFTPEHGRAGSTETLWSPRVIPHSPDVAPVPPSTMPHVDYFPQPESAPEPTIRMEHKPEDTSELEFYSTFPSKEECKEEHAQRAMVLDMSARIWFQEERQSLCQGVCTTTDGPSALIPSHAAPVSRYGGCLLVSSHMVEPCGPTYSYPASLPTMTRPRQNAFAFQG